MCINQFTYFNIQHSVLASFAMSLNFFHSDLAHMQFIARIHTLGNVKLKMLMLMLMLNVKLQSAPNFVTYVTDSK